MLNCSAKEDCKVGRAAADVDQAGAELFLVLRQHRVTGSKLLQHDVVDLQPATLHTLDDVLRGALRARDHVHFCFQAHAGHADWLADSFLVIDQELLRQDVQDLLISRDCDRSGCVDDPVDVAGAHLFVTNSHDAVRVQAAHVAARNSRVDRVDIAARHQLGFLDGALNRMHRRLDVDDHTFFQATGRVRTDADHFDLATVTHNFAHNGDDFGRADVESDDQVLVASLAHSFVPLLPVNVSASASISCACPAFAGSGAACWFAQPMVKPLL